MPNNTQYADVQRLPIIQSIDVDSMGDNLIMNEIQSVRSNLNLVDSNDSTSANKTNAETQARLQESHCHAFYRILGLPVIHKNKTKFYNPGWIGSEDSQDQKSARDEIDNNQDESLGLIERQREANASNNALFFNNSENKLKYRIDMLKAPISVLLADTNLDAFSPDASQIKTNYKNRSYFTNVGKILRPFKCNSFLCNNVEPVKNKMYAPFVIEQKVLGASLTRTYLEFVAQSRFSSDVINKSEKNEFKESLQSILTALQSSSITDSFTDKINSLTNVEAYIFGQMLLSFYSICVKIKQDMEKNIDLGNQLNMLLQSQDISVSNAANDNIKLNTLDLQISSQQSLLAERELMLAFLPTGKQVVDGVSLANKINCKLNNTFLQITQTDIDTIKTNIKNLTDQKNKTLQKFNSINKKSFYLLGEVTGIGLLDIMALMMAFWVIPQDHLLGMIDQYSFIRMYRDTNLRNTVVESRNSKPEKASPIPISQAINAYDKTVLNLLQIATDIINA